MKKYRGIFLKNEQEIAHLREANRMVCAVLDELGKAVQPGIETMALEEIAMRMCREFGVQPAFKGYHGFPYCLCCSVNEEVVHGFPSSRVLKEGDIVSLDMGVVHNGFYGDSARTFPVGAISESATRLLQVTEASLMRGIEMVRPGNQLYDVSAAIHEHVRQAGFDVVRRFVGHGIGCRLHEKPEIPNFVPKGMPGVPLKVGMVLAIEPMVTMGASEVEILDDNWTAVTKDRSLAAHFEHSVAVTDDGPYILSVP
ncbi:type I methionyl aminopeptidase [Megalodesulfovibrio paquesii]